MIYKSCRDHRGLHQVFLDQSVVYIHIGVVVPPILHSVLHEGETRKSDCLESTAIRSHTRLGQEMFHSQVMKWFQPFRKDRNDGFKILIIDPADLAGTGIQVEIAGELIIFRFFLTRFQVIKVIFDISPGPDESGFLGSPQCNTDGPAWLYADCF